MQRLQKLRRATSGGTVLNTHTAAANYAYCYRYPNHCYYHYYAYKAPLNVLQHYMQP